MSPALKPASSKNNSAAPVILYSQARHAEQHGSVVSNPHLKNILLPDVPTEEMRSCYRLKIER